MNSDLKELQDSGRIDGITLMPDSKNITVRVTDGEERIHTVTYKQTAATPGGAPDDDSLGIVEWVGHTTAGMESDDESTETAARAARLCVEDAGYTIEGQGSPFHPDPAGGD